MKLLAKKNIQLLVLSALCITLSACALKWTDAIKHGSIGVNEFSESVDFTVESKLIFVPVSINGKSYRFLLDTGAPFSISEEIQEALRYKVVAKGGLVDSDRNRVAVKYVAVDSIHIGSVAFLDQTAFVGDFKANPTLECLKIDGIIGSNLMRHCNWTIDQQNNVLTLTHTLSEDVKADAVVVPFKRDNQYDIMMDIEAGSSTITSIKLDYGSNGGISLPGSTFDKLQGMEGFEHIMVDRGYKQSGLAGKPVAINRRSVIIDSVGFEDMRLDHVEIRTGKSGLLGNRFLAGYLVSIDWQNKQIYFIKNTDVPPKRNFGFSIGYTTRKGMYVQSVRDDSYAHQQGIQPGMLVEKLDTLDFTKGSSYCDYVSFMQDAPDTLEVYLKNEEGISTSYTLEAVTLLSQ